MAFFIPYVDPAGLHLPLLQDCIDQKVNEFLAIMPAGFYMDNDSLWYQLKAIEGLAQFDSYQTIQLAYNNVNPQQAAGVALDSNVQLNGLKRLVPSYSTCPVVLTGTPGAVIGNGVVDDPAGNGWALPVSIIIGADGTATTTAICQTIGAIAANPGDLSGIGTPTDGWISVTNPGIATIGQPVEQDSTLRGRQVVSVAGPSSTLFIGTQARIAATAGVTRFLCLENPNGLPATDPNGLGLPGHSLTCVVEGATDDQVARAIYGNCGVGCFLNGSTQIVITDLYGAKTTVNFFRPTYVPIWVTLTVHPLAGFTTQTVKDIQAAIVVYLNALQIYEAVTMSGLWGAALSIMPNLAKPLFSISGTMAWTSSGGQTDADIPIAFTAVAEGLAANVSVVQA